MRSPRCMKSYNTNNTFKDENVELAKYFFLKKYSASKMTLVATLVVWSSHCWTRHSVSYGNTFITLKCLQKRLKLSMTTCKQGSESSFIFHIHHKSLWKSIICKNRQPLHFQSLEQQRDKLKKETSHPQPLCSFFDSCKVKQMCLVANVSTLLE